MTSVPPDAEVRPEARAPIRLAIAPTRTLVALAVAAAVVSAAASWWVTVSMWQPTSPLDGGFRLLLTAISTLGTVLVVVPILRAVQAARSVSRAGAAGDRVLARRTAALSRQRSAISMGGSAAFLVVTVITGFLVVNDATVQKTFLQPELIGLSLPDILSAFKQNVFIALVAEVFVLIAAMFVALVRTAPTAAARPLRVLSIVYIDVFRGVPAIIVVYLVGFGLPLTGLPWVSELSGSWYAIIALTLSYTAYVAEVYRSGLESIHPSQISAARSLGFSHLQTMRVVVAPQGVRRVIPALLNDFVALQKDTAVVGIIGSVEAFNQSKIYAGNYFNLSSVTVVALLFLLITIPQARFLDRHLSQQARKRSRS